MGLSALIYLSDSFRARWKNIYPATLSYRGNVQPVFRALGYRKFSCRPHQPEGGIYYKTGGSGSIASAGNADRLKHLKENPGELEGTEPADLHPHFCPIRQSGRKACCWQWC